MFSCTFFPFLGSKLNLPYFDRKRTLIGQVFLTLLSPKDVLIEMHSNLLSENDLAVKMLTSLKNS